MDDDFGHCTCNEYPESLKTKPYKFACWECTKPMLVVEDFWWVKLDHKEDNKWVCKACAQNHLRKVEEVYRSNMYNVAAGRLFCCRASHPDHGASNPKEK